jgi:hypothetical protein
MESARLAATVSHYVQENGMLQGSVLSVPMFAVAIIGMIDVIW